MWPSPVKIAPAPAVAAVVAAVVMVAAVVVAAVVMAVAVVAAVAAAAAEVAAGTNQAYDGHPARLALKQTRRGGRFCRLSSFPYKSIDIRQPVFILFPPPSFPDPPDPLPYSFRRALWANTNRHGGP